ncbi:hypothetical protein HanIR_Chr05g0220341 [Helianthus annuus]|nr:hypothetical protein HanIR_Chr05g0220341 [Helianthus annuus]
MLRSESSLDQKIENPNDLIRSLSTLSSYSRHRQAPPHRNPSLHRTGIHRSTAPASIAPPHRNPFFHISTLSFTLRTYPLSHLNPFFTPATTYRHRW